MTTSLKRQCLYLVTEDRHRCMARRAAIHPRPGQRLPRNGCAVRRAGHLQARMGLDEA